MSSLAASRADNFYFPPEWRPEMGGISKYQGSKGANQYQQNGVIRFELPFDGWCLACEQHLGKGLRFNAKKEKEGKYFSTTIWSFSMKCNACSQRFKILTDPANRTYNYAEGLRKHEQEYTPDFDDSVIEAITDGSTTAMVKPDPMQRMEKDKTDLIRAQTEAERFHRLYEVKDSQSRMDYDANASLRRRHREEKNRAKGLRDEGRSRGLSIPLLAPSVADSEAAARASFASSSYRISEAVRMQKIQSESIFSIRSERNEIKKVGGSVARDSVDRANYDNASGKRGLQLSNGSKKRSKMDNRLISQEDSLEIAAEKHAQRRIDVSKFRLADRSMSAGSQHRMKTKVLKGKCLLAKTDIGSSDRANDVRVGVGVGVGIGVDHVVRQGSSSGVYASVSIPCRSVESHSSASTVGAAAAAVPIPGASQDSIVKGVSRKPADTEAGGALKSSPARSPVVDGIADSCSSSSRRYAPAAGKGFGLDQQADVQQQQQQLQEEEDEKRRSTALDMLMASYS